MLSIENVFVFIPPFLCLCHRLAFVSFPLRTLPRKKEEIVSFHSQYTIIFKYILNNNDYVTVTQRECTYCKSEKSHLLCVYNIKSQTYPAINEPKVKNFLSIYLNRNIYHHEVPITKLIERKGIISSKKKKKRKIKSPKPTIFM